VGDVEGGARLEHPVDRTEGPLEQLGETLGLVVSEAQAGGGLALVGDAVGRVGPQALGSPLSQQARVALGVAGVGAQEAMLAEAQEVAGTGLGLVRERRRLVVCDRIGGELVEQL
jgi:hypothetical protein